MAPEDGGTLDDDQEHDPGSRRPPPHPLDRVWVHPSELPPLDGARTGGLTKLVAMASGLAVGAGIVAIVIAVATSGPGSTREKTNGSVPGNLSQAVVAVTVGDGEDSKLGSGVSIGDGQIVTSGHLVGPGSDIEVTDTDGNDHDAVVVGQDEVYDLALLEVDADLPAATLGRADLVGDGTRLMAIAATAPSQRWIGLTEITERDVVAQSAHGDALFAGLLATDLPSTAAHAGGALVSNDGRVIAILMAPPGTEITGAAIPIERVTGVCDQIRRNGTAQHGWFGVLVEDSVGGARIDAVRDGGPADRDGLRVGDVIYEINGQEIDDAGALVSTVRAHRPGDELEVGLLREGREHMTTVRLGALELGSLATS